jgi:hypothetical protein
VDDHLQPQLAGQLDGAVRAAVVDQDKVVDAAGRDVGQGRGEGLLGVEAGSTTITLPDPPGTSIVWSLRIRARSTSSRSRFMAGDSGRAEKVGRAR